MSIRPEPHPRAAYPLVTRLTTRWPDNDRHEVALAEGQALAAAQGHWVHVYLDPLSRRPVVPPTALGGALQALEAA